MSRIFCSLQQVGVFKQSESGLQTAIPSHSSATATIPSLCLEVTSGSMERKIIHSMVSWWLLTAESNVNKRRKGTADRRIARSRDWLTYISSSRGNQLTQTPLWTDSSAYVWAFIYMSPLRMLLCCDWSSQHPTILCCCS